MVGKIVIEGVLLGALLVLLCAVGIRRGAVTMVFLYHADVQDRCVQNGLITRERIWQNRKIFKGLGISIARALLKNAPIVLLDEATASLDVENETKVQGALSRLLAGKTVLVIAHRMRTVEAADKIVVLTEGQVVEEGSPAELLARENGVSRRMAQLQSASASWSI